SPPQTQKNNSSYANSGCHAPSVATDVAAYSAIINCVRAQLVDDASLLPLVPGASRAGVSSPSGLPSKFIILSSPDRKRSLQPWLRRFDGLIMKCFKV